MRDYMQELSEANDNVTTWEEPIFNEESHSIEPVNLIEKDSDDLLSQLCKQISDVVQFPLSTVYAHCLGCVASAMNRSFYVDIRGSLNPVNLYMVGSQPPSTGKSGVNGFLSDPIELAYLQLNKNNAPKRAKLNKKIKKIVKEIAEDEKSGSVNEDETIDKLKTLAGYNEELEKIPEFRPFFTNATPEALESHAMKQQGVFNIVSDESGSILSSLGITYGDSSKLSNADMVLQGWDKNRLSTIRVSRDPSFGRPRGVFAVLAQDETIESILAQGERGVGIAERFLICREKHLLGSRDHMKDFIIDDSLLARYALLVNHLVLCDGKTIFFNAEAELFVRTQKQIIEPDLGDHGKYGNNVMRGVLGKMDKQVYKIASILHASDCFENGITNHKVTLETAKKAFNIYMELTKVYINTSDEKGFNGLKAQVESVIQYLQRHIIKGALKIKTRTLLSNIKNSPSWKGQPKQTSHFAANIMPLLHKQNICRYTELGTADIIINPSIN